MQARLTVIVCAFVIAQSGIKLVENSHEFTAQQLLLFKIIMAGFFLCAATLALMRSQK